LIYNVQHNTSIAKGCGIGAAVMLFLFEGAFTVGFQATVWVYPAEILPLRLRQRGSSVSTACKCPIPIHPFPFQTSSTSLPSPQPKKKAGG